MYAETLGGLAMSGGCVCVVGYLVTAAAGIWWDEGGGGDDGEGEGCGASGGDSRDDSGGRGNGRCTLTW